MSNIANAAPPQLGTDPTPAGLTAAAKAAAAIPSPPAPAISGTEQVSVSANAVTASGLLQSARDSDGIDELAVVQLKNAIQNGSYDVSADDLAQAMLGAMKESMP